MEWDNEKCLQLIALYETKPELWQPDHKHRYNKSKKDESWEEIASKMGVHSHLCKGKINSLLASHRREMVKERSSKGAGKSHEGGGYSSKWFAFEALSFIKDKKKTKRTPSSSFVSHKSYQVGHLEDVESGDRSDVEDDEEDYDSANAEDERTSAASSWKGDRFVQPPGTCGRKRKSPSSPADAGFAGKVQQQQQQRRDACDVYGEHVAMKLKTYDRKTQAIVQHCINNVIFQADMGSLQEPLGVIDISSYPLLRPTPNPTQQVPGSLLNKDSGQS